MAMITYVFTINHFAKMLGEVPELLEAIVCNDDNLSYGSLISVYDGTDAHARRSTNDWKRFPRRLRLRPRYDRTHQSEISTVTIGRLHQTTLPQAAQRVPDAVPDQAGSLGKMLGRNISSMQAELPQETYIRLYS